MNLLDIIISSLPIITAFFVVASGIWYERQRRKKSGKLQAFAQAVLRLDELYFRMHGCIDLVKKMPRNKDLQLDYLESAVQRSEITIKVMINTRDWYDNPKFSHDIFHLIRSCEDRLTQFEEHLSRCRKHRYSFEP
jgi:hypothetical protein